MNCEQFREIAGELARDQMRDPGEIGEALAHSESCAECDGLLEGYESLHGALRALSAAHAHDEMPGQAEQVLLRAFANRRARESRAAALSTVPRRLVWAAAISGVAAAALLGVWLVPHFRPAGGSPFGAGLASASVASAAPVPNDPSTIGQADWAAPFATDAGETQPFVPLSDTFDPASVGDDSIVRVVVPRDTLEGLGVSVGEDASDQVLADVIVTDDGTPQAVRVLSW